MYQCTFGSRSSVMFMSIPGLRDTDWSSFPKRLTLAILLPNSNEAVAIELLLRTLLLSGISLWADFKMPKIIEGPGCLTKISVILSYYTCSICERLGQGLPWRWWHKILIYLNFFPSHLHACLSIFYIHTKSI